MADVDVDTMNNLYEDVLAAAAVHYPNYKTDGFANVEVVGTLSVAAGEIVRDYFPDDIDERDIVMLSAMRAIWRTFHNSTEADNAVVDADLRRILYASAN